MELPRKFAFYLLRWQLSTPILWLVVRQLGTGLEATIVANLVGGAIFFWVDRVIFGGKFRVEWELMANGACADCGSQGLVRRLVLAPSRSKMPYDRRADTAPEYRCPACSAQKVLLLRGQGQVAASVGF